MSGENQMSVDWNDESKVDWEDPQISDLATALLPQDIQQSNEVSGELVVQSGKQQSKPAKKRKKQIEKIPYEIDEETLICTVCNHQYHCLKTLKSHMGEHYQNYLCQFCGKTFVNYARFKQHRKMHKEGPFVCQHCSEIFENVNTYHSHIQAKHKKQNLPYNCKLCDERYSSYAKRQRHMRLAHGDDIRYKCPHCPNTYTNSGNCSRHIASVHARQRSHKCSKCEASFQHPYKLKDHEASVHMIGTLPHKCEICDKMFRKKASYEQHVRAHKGERRFKCDFCHVRFLQKGALEQHMFTHLRRCDRERLKKVTSDKVRVREIVFTTEREKSNQIENR